MVNYNDLLAKLPYSHPFLFVDEILSANENGIVGTFRFDKKHDFYAGHFKNFPVTPGVILTETMAQIGVVCFGIYLLGADFSNQLKIALSSTEIEFLKPVFPNEKVTVSSEKIYFRFGKLKCRVKMTNDAGEEVCSGTIAGMITNQP